MTTIDFDLTIDGQAWGTYVHKAWKELAEKNALERDKWKARALKAERNMKRGKKK